ncbi:MAG: RidA family protein [Halorhodospira halophila]|uniref:RidA family protein n=1 Tax=Halorhodospira TaxID=85108 RepID=UPI001913BFE1|nr:MULTISPECIES: RidA family protein [Halorhodospira]MBK5943288.1 reactive intermediate/imine deaminase [Halorhodospira halophila]MCC3751724.1 RidA family protein [Halorhodospira halophila]MCG5526811.1 RidA family protein [Halorhodospira halophila]MCG5533337.1 RidA family protein [Halorhodospira sp. 9621]MCG5537826.1 RidA family protein [Halorhodospira sp. 9622]
MSRETIHTEAAPAAIGPYSQAVRAGDFVYISGQIPLDPQTGELVGADMHSQVARVFENLGAVAEAAGGTLADAVRIAIYLTDLSHFALVNEVMTQYLSEPYPSRAALGVAALPKGAAVEMDAVLYLPREG